MIIYYVSNVELLQRLKNSGLNLKKKRHFWNSSQTWALLEIRLPLKIRDWRRGIQPMKFDWWRWSWSNTSRVCHYHQQNVFWLVSLIQMNTSKFQNVSCHNLEKNFQSERAFGFHDATLSFIKTLYSQQRKLNWMCQITLAKTRSSLFQFWGVKPDPSLIVRL